MEILTGDPELRPEPKADLPIPPRYSLEHKGQRLEVEASDIGLGHKALLFIDGELRDERRAQDQRAELHTDGFTVRITWGDFGGVKTCALVGTADQVPNLPFAPPPGSRAARQAQFARKQPALYAARHLVKPVLQALVPLLGVGAILTALLPRIDWRWLPPFIRDKLLSNGPDWLEPILASPVFQMGKWLIPIVLTLFVALDEYKKHRESKANKGGKYGPHR